MKLHKNLNKKKQTLINVFQQFHEKLTLKNIVESK